jgi:hypothetical protein
MLELDVIKFKNNVNFNLTMVVQILNSIPPLVTNFLNIHYLQQLANIRVRSAHSFAFDELIEEMNSGRTEHVDINDFTDTFFIKNAQDFVNHSPITLIDYILRKISTEYNHDDNLIDKDFLINQTITVMCNGCSSEKFVDHKSLFLNLIMPKETNNEMPLIECLSKQIITCPKCNTKNSIEKCPALSNLPNVLICNLNRKKDKSNIFDGGLVIAELTDFNIGNWKKGADQLYDLVAFGTLSGTRLNVFTRNILAGDWYFCYEKVSTIDNEKIKKALLSDKTCIYVYVIKKLIPEIMHRITGESKQFKSTRNRLVCYNNS